MNVSTRLCHSEPVEESINKRPAKRLNYDYAPAERHLLHEEGFLHTFYFEITRGMVY